MAKKNKKRSTLHAVNTLIDSLLFVTIHAEEHCRLTKVELESLDKLLVEHLKQQRMIVILRDINVFRNIAKVCASLVVCKMVPLEIPFPIAWMCDMNDKNENASEDESDLFVGVVGPVSKFEQCKWIALPPHPPFMNIKYTDLVLCTVCINEGINDLELFLIISSGLTLPSDPMGIDHLSVATLGLIEPRFSDDVHMARQAHHLPDNPRQIVLLVHTGWQGKTEAWLVQTCSRRVNSKIVPVGSLYKRKQSVFASEDKCFELQILQGPPQFPILSRVDFQRRIPQIKKEEPLIDISEGVLSPDTRNSSNVQLQEIAFTTGDKVDDKEREEVVQQEIKDANKQASLNRMDVRVVARQRYENQKKKNLATKKHNNHTLTAPVHENIDDTTVTITESRSKTVHSGDLQDIENLEVIHEPCQMEVKKPSVQRDRPTLHQSASSQANPQKVHNAACLQAILWEAMLRKTTIKVEPINTTNA